MHVINVYKLALHVLYVRMLGYLHSTCDYISIHVLVYRYVRLCVRVSVHIQLSMCICMRAHASIHIYVHAYV